LHAEVQFGALPKWSTTFRSAFSKVSTIYSMENKKCTICDFETENGRVFSNHVRWKHKEKPYSDEGYVKITQKKSLIKKDCVCNKCGQTFSKELLKGEWAKIEKKQEGRIYCSKKCANSRNISPEQRKLASEFQSILKDYICISCSLSFKGKIKSGRLVKCKECRKPRVVKDNVKTILDYSKRTVAKIIKRAKLKCAMCNWDETSLDIHHIIERKNGGTNDMNNLIAICPNCHRKAHERKYTKEQLRERTLDKILLDWKDLYATR
jgi:hypothetical protein